MAATKNACAFHTSPLFETYLYCVHGVLHCLGFDDGTPARRLIMRARKKIYEAVEYQIRGPMAVVKSEAIVLRRRDLRETSLLGDIFTRDSARLQAN